jgi:PAS domain S-box-containing protein
VRSVPTILDKPLLRRRPADPVLEEVALFVQSLLRPAFLLDSDNRVVFANQAASVLMDQPEDPELARRLLAEDSIALRSGASAVTRRLRFLDHTVVMLDTQVLPALSEQASLLDLFDRTGLAIVIFDQDLKIRFFSKAAAEYSGVLGAEGKSLTDVFNVRPEVVAFYRSVIKSGTRTSMTGLQPIDPRLPSSLNLTALPVGNELLVVYENNETAERNLARFRGLGDSLSVALFMIDQEFRVTFWNQKAKELTGLSVEEAVGRPARELFPFIDRDVLSGLESALKTHTDFGRDRVAYDYRHVSGYFNVKASPVGSELAILIEDVTSEVRVEELLRGNKERFRSMSDNLSIAFVLLDRNNCVTFWNKACEVASEIPAAKALGSPAIDVLPFTQERIEKLMNDARATPEGVRQRVEPERPGVRATYDVRAFHIADEVGILLEDVTQQVKQAAELAQSNKLFLDLYENAPCGYMTVRPTGGIEQINRRMREWLGLEDDRLLQNVSEMLTSESHTKLHEFIARSGVDTPLQNLELEFRKADGNTFWGLTNALPIFDEIQRAWYWRWTVVDITERRKIQTELDDTLLFNQLFNELGEAVLISDAQGKIIRANEAAARILGMPIETLTKLTHDDPTWRAVLEDGTPVPIDQLPGVRALRERRPVSNLELGVVRPDGKLTWILESAAPLFDREGKVSGVIVTFPEVTATVMQRQSLKDLNDKYQIERDRANEANRLKSSFLANMSHEIRTPMTAILGFSDILASELSGKVTEQHYTFLRSINISGKRLLNLINDILDLSKIEAGRLELHMEELDVRNEIEAAVTPLTWIAKQKGLPILLQTGIEHIFVRGDRQRIAQVLTNIISNAIKFTRTGSITIRTFVTQEESLGSAKQVNIEIEDTGIGISREFLPHLFEEFRQEHTGATKEFGGTGLGLAISRRLISLMGGRIHLRSQQGVGTTFTLQFPLASGTNAPLPVARPVIHRPTVTVPKPARTTTDDKKLVLVVEDNPETQRLLEVYLKNSYRIAQAFNATDAHSEIRKEAPDVILMDVNLPGKDGLAITREIRSGSVCPDVPIIALTAFAMTGDRQRCLAAGCNDYLSKPATKREVLEKIEEMLKETADGTEGV